MAITKTKFINYTKCPYYYHLDNFKNSDLLSKVSFKDYFEEEYKFDNDVPDEQLLTMLPYYKKCEELAIDVASKYFSGTFIGSENTLDQECFECKINGILYACYVDIYNETEDGNINIIEVKSTTSDKFSKTNFFVKEGNVYYLKDINDAVNKKLLNRFDSCGKYIYDVAVQRYIIEHNLKKDGLEFINTKYYLAVLNSDYIFDGTYYNNEPIYNTDQNGNEIINFIDVTDITKLYLPLIDEERKSLEQNIKSTFDDTRVGTYCSYGKVNECVHASFCFRNLPEHNSVLSYLDNHHGFNDNGKKISAYDLINNGIYKMIDVPDNYLNRYKNIIQKKVVTTDKEYINLDKIEKALSLIKYPIYHLDFETFPCPLPRFRGEKCYTQSVFQFSLHIETEKGCDKELSHYGFLAHSTDDEREDLVKELCSLINKPGTVLVYNSSFEKSRLKELAVVFPQYKKQLDFINNMVFDLLDVVKTNKKLYMDLGFNEEDSAIFNYYHTNLDGSFSIKKVLPIFSNLSYKNLNVKNGVEALVTYSKFDKMSKDEYNNAYNSLIEYCKQDTWAMVEILHKLQKMSNGVK